jgi:NAD(P)-dependent dehydrogenase (short-subunit alcohol dehydrogenase family)
MFEDQKIHKVSPARMMAAFNVNCLGVLRVQQAVNGQMKSPGGKICILSTGMASIADNGSGGIHAYRCSKAAVNMLGKGIAVVNVAPGMVQTGFGPGAEMMKNMGAMSVGVSCKGLIKVFDDLTMENTGKYMCVYKDKDPEEFPSGW